MGIFLGSTAVTLYLNGTEAAVAGVYLGALQAFPTGPAANPFATLVSTKSTGNVAGDAGSTTGYIKVEWWDETSDVYGTGVAGNNINWSKAAGGAGEKTIKIYPSDVNGDLDGSLTRLNCSSNSLTSLDVSGLTALTRLNCSSNSLTSLDVSGLTALTELNCFSNSLTTLDVSGLTALTELACSFNSLTSLNVSGLTALTSLACSFNSLTSLDVSGMTALTELNCSSNSLTSLRAVGVPGSTYYGSTANYYYPYYGGVMAADNNLDAAALDQLYTDLADNTLSGSYALVFVGGNPGTADHDPSIATAKNWVVLLGA
jgi:hypothetical protein